PAACTATAPLVLRSRRAAAICARPPPLRLTKTTSTSVFSSLLAQLPAQLVEAHPNIGEFLDPHTRRFTAPLANQTTRSLPTGERPVMCAWVGPDGPADTLGSEVFAGNARCRDGRPRRRNRRADAGLDVGVHCRATTVRRAARLAAGRVRAHEC